MKLPLGSKTQDLDAYYMKLAIKEAQKSLLIDEVPIGAIIVQNGKIIARAHNCVETKKNSLKHAEIIAIEKAIKKTGYKHLLDCTLYVTLEPCTMCAGAIVLSRIPKIVFGAYDAKAGCCGTVYNICGDGKLNHKPEIVAGVLQNECADMLSNFFSVLRAKKKSRI